MNKSEVSQAGEGLNVFWFLIHNGSSTGLALGKRNRLKEKGMIERVLHPHNMQRALKQVIANKGSAGVDRMSVRELTEHVRESKTTLYSSIRAMEYLPQPILGVEPRETSS
jgi:hypothetical protein